MAVGFGLFPAQNDYLNSDGYTYGYDVPLLTEFVTATDSAVMYYNDGYCQLIQNGDNIQYRDCSYNENTDTISVGNAYIMGTVEWNDNIIFGPTTTINGQNQKLDVGKWIPGNIIIPDGMAVTIPSGGTIQNWGTLTNGGILNIKGQVLNPGTIINNGALQVLEGELKNYPARGGKITENKIVDGVVHEYTTGTEDGTPSQFFFVAHGDAQLYLGDLKFQGNKNNTLLVGATSTMKQTMTVPSGSTLTIQAGCTLDASQPTLGVTTGTLSEYLSVEGNIVVDGTLRLPAGTTQAQIDNLHLSGSGQIIVADSTYYPITVNGGTADKSVAKAGDTVTLVAEETQGKQFSQWIVTPNTIEIGEDNSFTMPGEAVSITGKYDYIVNFDTRGGEEIEPQIIVEGGKVQEPETPIREGWTFDGWYTDVACTQVYNFDSTVNTALTLYAKWIDNSPPPPSGGSSGGSSTPTPPPVNTDTDTNDTTETTAKPSATTKGDTATATVNKATADEIVKQATQHQSETVVIAPEVKGDVTKTEVSIPAQTVGALGSETQASLTVSTPVADLTIPNGGLGDLASGGGTVTVTAEKKGDSVTLSITAGGETVTEIPGGVTLTVPHDECNPGTVAVLVYADGSREVVRKSIADEGVLQVTIPLDGSAKLEILDNSKAFDDVPEDNWAAQAVAFASGHELFQGTGGGKFSPEEPMSRGMLAVVLHNLERNPAAVGGSFDDVNHQQWYGEAVTWAAEQGIVTGYGDGKFGPNDRITREQLAVILWRYAGQPTASQDLPFSDAEQASSWALAALGWATEQGILHGKNGGILDPGGFATRAETAQMLMQFLKK